MSGARLLVPLGAALVLGAWGCDIPRDPRGTLERVRGDTLRVGVAAAPPWVLEGSGEPEGVEPELVRRFARELGAEIAWHRGPTAEHMEALAHYDLDLVIGGHTRASPWRRHVGLTAPWFVTEVRVAGPGAGSVEAEEIHDRRVAVSPAGPTAAHVRSAEGEPVPTEDLSTWDGPVAAPEWKLAHLGLDTTGLQVARHQQVMAVPPGENAFLMALENALRDADVPELLRRYAGRAP